jgi:hypothetical protein
MGLLCVSSALNVFIGLSVFTGEITIFLGGYSTTGVSYTGYIFMTDSLVFGFSVTGAFTA